MGQVTAASQGVSGSLVCWLVRHANLYSTSRAQTDISTLGIITLSNKIPFHRYSTIVSLNLVNTYEYK